MPEGDVVWNTARRLRQALAGRRLVRAELRVPRHADARLAGRTVLDVVSRGKHLLTRLDTGLTLHTHLGMDGRWLVHPAAEPWPSARSAVRAVLCTGESLVIGRQLARVDLVRTTAEDRLVGHLGPDPLGPDWDPDEVVRRMSRQPKRPVSEALLDQSNLAGVGNLYRAELLFLRGIAPSTPVDAVPDLRRLAELAHSVLLANCHGFEQSTTGQTRSGLRNYVYGRTGAPCRRCGARIRTDSARVGTEERRIWWCPHCQPERNTPGDSYGE